ATMLGTKNFRLRGWHVAALVGLLALVIGISLTSSGALARKLGDQYHPTAPSNVVVNGDFETGSISPFTTIINTGSGVINSDPAFVHNGAYSAKVTSNTTANSSSGVGGGGSCSGG